VWRLRRLAPQRLEFGEVVADRGRGDAAFAHRVADLVEALDHVAGGKQPGNAGALVGVDQQAAVGAGLGARFRRELRADSRAERGVDAVEPQAAGGRVEGDLPVLDGIAGARAVDASDAGAVEPRGAIRVERMFRTGRDERDFGRIAAPEFGLGGAVGARADDRHAPVGYFVGIADRAVAQQTLAECLGMERFGKAFGPVVDHTRGHQHRPGGEVAPFGLDLEAVAVAANPGDPCELALRAEPFGLRPHPREQFLARNPLGKARVVAGAGDQRRAAGTAVEQPDREVKAREIDRRGQACRSGADDDAVFHPLANAGGGEAIPSACAPGLATSTIAVNSTAVVATAARPLNSVFAAARKGSVAEGRVA
jgi:hypothetical protein